MLKNAKDFMKFGEFLISAIQSHFPGSESVRNVQIINGWSIFIYLQITPKLNCQFREWGGNPFYFVVEHRNRKLCQLDLTRLIEDDGRFTWYFSNPSNKETKKIFDSLFDFYEEVPKDYRKKVKEQKILLKSNPTVFKSGYLFIKDASVDELKSEFINLIQNLYEFSKDSSNWQGKRRKSEKIFNLDDIEAEEGYKEDKKYLYTQRNREIVEKRKVKDNYTCQICGFYFELDGKKIIECHHLKPLSDGEVRITNINDLISVCPTCHRIIHLRKPPFSPEEVKQILNN
ncbi:Putative restriction endonuclease [Ignavibacterium album JCM 16511]|uniref:Putative restriction endonuclease n=1 Tax=Ignavibacterium album (strain DSM 19864 / JCM 16511 / NBRC 101810 / Mat9-16) TaxID=945713 RepID=I0AIY3_IGNAJ|nr:HNH endonuclease [Ignavibacterium album]AFH48940.1 Putative restriction endonuclease [Ignavibacterium album JCM 16511]